RLGHRAGAKLHSHVLGIARLEGPALEPRRPLAHRVPGFRRTGDQRVHALDELTHRRNPGLERVLAPAPEQLLEATRATRRSLRAVPDACGIRCPFRVARAFADPIERFARLAECRVHPVDRGVHWVAVARRALPDEAAENRPLALELRAELRAAAREGLSANAQALVGRAQRRQPTPGSGALAIALGQ